MRQFQPWGLRHSQHAVRSALAFLLVLAAIGFVVVGATIMALQLLRLMPERGRLTLQTFFGAAWLFGAVISAVIIAAYMWARWLGHNGLDYIGLDSRYAMGSVGLILGLGTQAVSFGGLMALGWLQIQGVNWSGQAVINSALMTLTSLNAAVTEEIVFRGALYSAFRPSWGWWRTALVTAVITALFHFVTNAYPSLLNAGLGLLIGGMLFAWTREIAGTLWLPIGIHFGWDAAIGFLNLTASNTSHFLMTKLSGPAWAVGDWGLNDWTALAILGLGLLVITFKTRTPAGPRAQPMAPPRHD